MRTASFISARPGLLAVVLLVAATAGPAWAAHYNVSEVPLLVRSRDARKLHAAGVHSTEEILRAGATDGGRAALARSAGLPRATIVTLARRSDLLRLDEISPDWVLLLEAVGIKSVVDLGAREPGKLLAAIAAANGPRKRIANPPPADAVVRRWIDQAKKLPVAFVP
jgi:hypothetical protein